MIKILFLSIISALICTIIPWAVGIMARKSLNTIFKNLDVIIFSFVSEFVWISLFLYISCKPFTFCSAFMWMWPALSLNVLTNLDICKERRCVAICYAVLTTISLTICVFSIIGVVQELLYVHEMDDIEVSYAVSSDELLAKMELKIDDNKWNGIYKIDSPEMRNINGKDIAIYHIEDSGGFINETEYIPGFVVQEKNKSPEITTKRIYFDTSYVNNKDALRTIRRKYPTIFIGEHKFDIDDEYNPYEIFAYREKIFSTNGKDFGIVILNLMDGTVNKYSEAENKIPSWIDFKTTYPR